MDRKKLISLRMERQHLVSAATEEEYLALYRDLQPGVNVYWNGFGQPPTLCFRADFDDLEYNRNRQLDRRLIKGRFCGGTLGWIVPEDLELFWALYRKPLTRSTEIQESLLRLLCQEGPMTIQQIKAETGLLVKQITPVLHRLQEAFLIYEDQYDGEWDRGWMRFSEMFQEAEEFSLTHAEALKLLLRRFAYRYPGFRAGEAKAFYRLPEKELRIAAQELMAEKLFVEEDGAFFLPGDWELLKTYKPVPLHFVYAMHRNDFLYRVIEPELKQKFSPLYENLPYDHEPLQYLLMDGEFHGAVVGHFRNGPYDLNDVVCDLPDAAARREEILQAVQTVNFGRLPERIFGEPLT